MTHNTPHERYLAELRDLRAFSANESYRHALDYAIDAITSSEAGEGDTVAAAEVVREVAIGDAITVDDLAQKLALKPGDVVKALFKIGIMATITQTIDHDTAVLAVEELGHTAVKADAATLAPPPPVDGKWAKVRQWAAQAQRGEMNDAAFVFNVSFLAAAPATPAASGGDDELLSACYAAMRDAMQVIDPNEGPDREHSRILNVLADCRVKIENRQSLRAGFTRNEYGRPLAAPVAAAQPAEGVVDENARLREALSDLLSWFPDKPSPPEWRIEAGERGADDAVAAARAALHSTSRGSNAGVRT